VCSSDLLFGILCSSIAYIIYYPLIARVGPTRALTVTFLIPVFGMFWGAVILGEAVSLSMILGAAVILSGTSLVVAPGRKAEAETRVETWRGA
jgi:drug/metabolite transporter (DMT)-like permease